MKCLKDLYIFDFYTSNFTYIIGMFIEYKKLKEIKGINNSKFYKVNNISFIFTKY